MTIALPLNIRRLAALLLLGMSFALLISLTLLPLVGFVNSLIQQRRLELKQLSTLLGLVSAEPELRASVARIDAHPIWQRLYRNPVTGEAESELQGDFRALATSQGITVDTLQPLEPSAEKEFTRLLLRVGFNTTVDHLGQLLVAMAAAPHFMKFENLYVTSPMSQNGGSNAPLVVRGDVLAYVLPERSP